MQVRVESWAKEIAETCDPVIIAAPAPRCGTTAIQRLLISDPATVVYGEDRTLLDLAVYLREQVKALGSSRDAADLARARIRENAWHLRTTPDVDGYIKSCCEAFHIFAANFERDSRALGATRWALKLPGHSIVDLLAIRSFLPKTRIVYVVRDIRECMMSLKAYKPAASTAELCRKWVAHMRSWHEHRDACFTVDFKRLENQPQAVAAELSSYLSMRLDSSVLTLRVNDGGGYRAPAPLTEEEEQLVAAARAAV